MNIIDPNNPATYSTPKVINPNDSSTYSTVKNVINPPGYGLSTQDDTNNTTFSKQVQTGIPTPPSWETAQLAEQKTWDKQVQNIGIPKQPWETAQLAKQETWWDKREAMTPTLQQTWTDLEDKEFKGIRSQQQHGSMELDLGSGIYRLRGQM